MRIWVIMAGILAIAALACGAEPTPTSPATPSPSPTATTIPEQTPVSIPTVAGIPIVDPAVARPSPTAGYQNPTNIGNAIREVFEVDWYSLSIWVPSHWTNTTLQMQQQSPPTRKIYYASNEVLATGLFSFGVSVSAHSEDPEFDLDQYIEWKVGELEKQEGTEVLDVNKTTYLGTEAVLFDVQFTSRESNKPFYSIEFVILDEGISMQIRCLSIENTAGARAICMEVLQSVGPA